MNCSKQFPIDAFKDVDSNFDYFLINDRDVFVFKFANGRGARVSKPAGLYEKKINVWELMQIVESSPHFWSVDPSIPILKDLIEVDIPPLLNALKSL